MNYSRGVLPAMCPPSFPALRGTPGPFLVDKTRLIENIVDNNPLTGDVDLVPRPRRCGKSTMLQCSSNYVGFYIHSVLKLVFPSKW